MGQRKNAVKKMLKLSKNRIVENCHWCHKSIVWWQKLPKEWIDLRHKNPTQGWVVNQEVTVNIGETQCTFSVATVDHVISIAKGGTNHINNLVPSCGKCNSAKDNYTKVYFYCRNCKTHKKKNTKEKFCNTCKVILKLIYDPKSNFNRRRLWGLYRTFKDCEIDGELFISTYARAYKNKK